MLKQILNVAFIFSDLLLYSVEGYFANKNKL